MINKNNNLIKFKNRLVGLDILKLICIIIIVFHHYQQVTGLYFNGYINFFGGVFYFGYIVELFFMISGFVCTYKCHKSKYEVKSLFINSFRKYYPLAFITITIYIITAMVNYIVNPRIVLFDFQPYTIIKSYMLLLPFDFNDGCPIGANNPLWYITVLLICILIYESFIYISKKNEKIIIFLSIIFVIFSLQCSDIRAPFINNTLLRGYKCFFIGTLLFYAFEYFGTLTLIVSLIGLIFIAICTFYRFPYMICRYEIMLFGYGCIVLLSAYSSIYISFIKPIYNLIIKYKNVSMHMFFWHSIFLEVVRLIHFILNYEYCFVNMIVFTLVLFITCIFIDKNYCKSDKKNNYSIKDRDIIKKL